MRELHLHQFVNSFFSSNTYILYKEDESSAWLIDCGDFAPIVKWCEEKNKRIEGAFITHSHFDHIYGLNDLLSYNQNAKIYTSFNGSVSLSSSRYNMSLYNERPFEYKGKSVILSDGDKVNLYGDVSLLAFSTPGHDWSCLTYKVDKYLFTGDSYIPGMKVVAKFPKSDKLQVVESLSKIQALTEGCSFICPGHENIQRINV